MLVKKFLCLQQRKNGHNSILGHSPWAQHMTYLQKQCAFQHCLGLVRLQTTLSYIDNPLKPGNIE